MTRRMVIAAAVVAFSLGTLPVLAQGRRLGGPGPGGPGGPGGPLVPGLNRLDLTDAQREQLRGIMEQARPGDPAADTVRQAEQALHTAVFADNPDPQAIDSAKAAVNAAHAAELDRRIALMQKVGQILTPAQRQELARMPGPGGLHGRGGAQHRH
jgi:Spy/CpxP family protein refolding chaperone